MKMIQIIFICLILPVSFLQVAQADEKQSSSEQTEEEMTGSERAVYAESLFDRQVPDVSSASGAGYAETKSMEINTCDHAATNAAGWCTTVDGKRN